MRLKYGLQRTLSLLMSLSLTFGAYSCSSSQQQGEDLENTSQDGNAEGSEEGGEAADGAAAEGEESVAYEENLEEQTDYNASTEEAAPAEGEPTADATENDLQEIITQMNQESNAPAGNEVLNPAAQDGNALAQAPAAPMNQAAPMAPAAGSVGGLPEMNSKMPYIIQRGDTLAKVAKKIYGDMARWTEIRDLSALPDPNRVYPGDVIYYALTPESTTFAQAYEFAPKSEITVQQGQTLADIAAQVYGESSDWKLIWRQNGHVSNPDKLEVGTIIYYVDQAALSAFHAEVSSKALAAKQGKASSKVRFDYVSKNVRSVNTHILAMI